MSVVAFPIARAWPLIVVSYDRAAGGWYVSAADRSGVRDLFGARTKAPAVAYARWAVRARGGFARLEIRRLTDPTVRPTEAEDGSTGGAA